MERPPAPCSHASRTIRFRIGEPLSPDDLFDPEGEGLSEALARVGAAVQDLVDRE